jgi:acyl carrier protein
MQLQDPVYEKLESCFEKVFPALPKSAIPTATHDNVSGWDSMAQITLLTLIGEEFGLDIDFEEFEGATSFALLLEAVREKSANEQ